MFNIVFLSLGKNLDNLTYRSNVGHGKLSLKNQFFLTLWKLRKNATDFELLIHFGIHEKQVGNIFISWIVFMARQWSKIDLWPSKELINYYMPKSFKVNFPNTRVIIDGTEIHIQKSKNPKVQQSSFS